MNNSTFISEVVTNMSAKTNRNGKIAQMVDSADAPLTANRIAIVWDQLSKKRKAASKEAVVTGIPAKEMLEKPEHILSFIQQVMNSSCWAARRVINSGKQTDLANGLDFSQSVAEQAGNIESAHIKDVECTLMDDFQILNELHSWLCGQMNYMTDLTHCSCSLRKKKLLKVSGNTRTCVWISTMCFQSSMRKPSS